MRSTIKVRSKLINGKKERKKEIQKKERKKEKERKNQKDKDKERNIERKRCGMTEIQEGANIGME